MRENRVTDDTAIVRVAQTMTCVSIFPVPGSHCLYARDRNRSVEVLQARDVVLVNGHCGEAETLGCVEAGLWLGGWGKFWALIMPYWQWGGGISSWEPVYSIRRGHERSAVRRRRTLDQKCD